MWALEGRYSSFANALNRLLFRSSQAVDFFLKPTTSYLVNASVGTPSSGVFDGFNKIKSSWLGAGEGMLSVLVSFFKAQRRGQNGFQIIWKLGMDGFRMYSLWLEYLLIAEALEADGKLPANSAKKFYDDLKVRSSFMRYLRRLVLNSNATGASSSSFPAASLAASLPTRGSA